MAARPHFNSLTKTSRSVWIPVCAGVAALCGLWGMVHPNRGVATAATVAAGATVALTLGSGVGSQPSSAAAGTPQTASASDPKAPQIPYPSQWDSRWKSQTSQQDWEWKGKASVIDFGDNLVAISRDENAKGVYVLELKRQDQKTVSGIWWFYGNQPPAGTFRGTFTDDQSTHLEGSWFIAQGEAQNSGAWDLSRISDTPANGSQSESTPLA